jgi:pimeloyl-ACP methyl ester carboxylesterase
MDPVVLVHGAFHELWGPNRLGFRWAPSLFDGLWAAGVDTRALGLFESVRESVHIAFWGDLFRPEPIPVDEVLAGLAAADEQSAVTDVGDRLADEGLAAIDAIGAKVAALDHHRSTQLLAQYFTDQDVRDRVIERVDRCLDEHTRVVVAHSMGTVVAYEALSRRPDLDIAAFVTLGSPLGTQGMVFEMLQPAPVDGRGSVPACVRRWTNVSAQGDLATLAAPRLAERFGDDVVDEYVYNGRHPHDIEPYLTTAETGRAVAAGLGLELAERRSVV